MTTKKPEDKDEIKVSADAESAQAGCEGDPANCKQDPSKCASNSSLLGPSPSGHEPRLDECLARSLDDLAQSFMSSAKRWEMVVYPSLFAFVVLSIYGFFLIYSLTQDARVISEQMLVMADDMTTMTVNMQSISQNMVLMTQTLDVQSQTMASMDRNMGMMTASINQMRYDMSIMNQSVSRPMSFMNSFMPW